MDNLIGVEHEDSIATIEARKMEIMKPELEKINNELKEIEGFIDVKEKETEIKKRLKDVVSGDPNYKDFANKLRELVNSHPFFKNNNNSDKTNDTSSNQTF
jgi:hypothetical protein